MKIKIGGTKYDTKHSLRLFKVSKVEGTIPIEKCFLWEKVLYYDYKQHKFFIFTKQSNLKTISPLKNHREADKWLRSHQIYFDIESWEENWKNLY